MLAVHDRGHPSERPEEDQRDRYRRTVKQRGADALASVDGGACSGCYVTLTHQVMNELINGHNLQFCMTCGRMLYLNDEDHGSPSHSAANRYPTPKWVCT